MSQWTVDRKGLTLAYRRTHVGFDLAVIEDECGWWWAVRDASLNIIAEGRCPGPVGGMEAADYALREVVR